MRSTAFVAVGLLFLIVGFTAAAANSEKGASPVEPVEIAVDPGEATAEGQREEAGAHVPTTAESFEESDDAAGERTSDGTIVDAGSGPSLPAMSATVTPEPEVRSTESDRRSRWRSRRNRYPAPTFTPDEWRPPEGPVRIALQAGHWRADEAPDELDGLRYGGTRWEGLAEWEVNLALAERTGEMLEELGYEVDILPAVVPPDYHAHLFIAIHADGAADPAARGYRIAAPSRDYTGRAQEVVDLMKDTYGEATGLRQLPDVTRRMRNYYAFNVRRYEHSLDPRTIALILETGFLTSPMGQTAIDEYRANGSQLFFPNALFLPVPEPGLRARTASHVGSWRR